MLPGLVLGIGGGGADSQITTPGRGRDDVESDDYLAYARLHHGAHRFEIQWSLRDNGANRLRVVRLLRDGELATLLLRSRVDSEESALALTWSADVSLDSGVYLSPALGLSRHELETDDYLESGGGALALLVETADETQLLADASLTLGYLGGRGAWAFSPGLQVRVSHALDADDTVTTSTFQGTRFGFTSRGYSVEKTRRAASLTLAAYHASGLGLGLGITREWQDDYRYDALTASIDFTF